MPIFEVAFKVRHECPACNLSRDFPTAKMLGWCNRGYEVVEISASDQSQLDPIRKAARSLGGVMQVTSHGENDLIITKKCLCTARNSVLRNLDSHNMLHLLPIAYEAGWEYYRAIAFRDRDFVKFSEAVERLPSEIVVLRKSLLEGRIGGLITVSLSDLFANLTSKQIEALLTAYLMGYFAFPRKTNVLHIAKMKNLARTTFQEHLNKAENKMVSRLAPYLQLVQTKSMPQAHS
jgi:hypothetical protein